MRKQTKLPVQVHFTHWIFSFVSPHLRQNPDSSGSIAAVFSYQEISLPSSVFAPWTRWCWKVRWDIHRPSPFVEAAGSATPSSFLKHKFVNLLLGSCGVRGSFGAIPDLFPACDELLPPSLRVSSHSLRLSPRLHSNIYSQSSKAVAHEKYRPTKPQPIIAGANSIYSVLFKSHCGLKHVHLCSISVAEGTSRQKGEGAASADFGTSPPKFND